MPSGSYLVTTTVITYLSEDVFNDCDSIESVVGKGYRVLVTFDNTPILDRPYIDTLNSLVSHTGYAVVNVGVEATLPPGGGIASPNVGGNEGARSAPGGSRASPYNSTVLRTYSNLPLMLLGGVKSITIVFEHLGEVVSGSS